jgi:hypothetical protein
MDNNNKVTIDEALLIDRILFYKEIIKPEHLGLIEDEWHPLVLLYERQLLQQTPEYVMLNHGYLKVFYAVEIDGNEDVAEWLEDIEGFFPRSENGNCHAAISGLQLLRNYGFSVNVVIEDGLITEASVIL